MIAKSRNYYRQDRPSFPKGNRDFTFAFATMNMKDTRKQVRKTYCNDHSCLCGKNYSFSRCFYLNPSMEKPHWFKENPAIQGQINRALQDEDTKQKVNNQLSRIERIHQNTVHSPTLEVSLSALEHEHESELAFPVLVNSKLQPTNYLFSSWIVYMAGGRHICNESMKERLTNMRRSENGFLTGNASTSSGFTASAYLFADTKLGNKEVNIGEVLVVSGFHTNIISMKQLRRKKHLPQRAIYGVGRPIWQCHDQDQRLRGILVIEHNAV